MITSINLKTPQLDWDVEENSPYSYSEPTALTMNCCSEHFCILVNTYIHVYSLHILIFAEKNVKNATAFKGMCKPRFSNSNAIQVQKVTESTSLNGV